VLQTNQRASRKFTLAKLTKFSVLTVLLLSSTGIFADEVDFQKLKGIPILSAPAYSMEVAKADLQSSIMQQLKHLDNWKDFGGFPKNKAVAIEYRGPFENPLAPYLDRYKYITASVGYWGGAWGYDKLEDAQHAALGRCKGDCIPFLENDSVVLPEKLVRDYADYRQKYIASQIALLGKADKIVLIDRARSGPQVGTSRALSLAAPKPIIVGYPDQQQDYASACFDHVFQALLPADGNEKDYIAELTRVIGRGLYDPYHRAVNTVLDYTTSRDGRIMNQMARFAAHYQFEANPVHDKTLVLPPNLNEALADEVVQEIWVEGSARLTTSGLPLEIDQEVSLLAIKTNKHFYLGTQIRMPDDTGGCYVSMPFANKVLDVTSCSGSYVCAKKAVDGLLDTIRQRLRAEPFLAQDIQNEPFGPGEFGLKREYQPSHILGAPYYELSTYLIQTWAAESEDPFYSLYQRQRYMGLDEKRAAANKVIIFMKLNHVLTTSIHKNGNYGEPRPEEIQKFDAELNTAIADSITKACADMKSKMDGSVCELSPQ
jgi:hypothetical protein